MNGYALKAYSNSSIIIASAIISTNLDEVRSSFEGEEKKEEKKLTDVHGGEIKTWRGKRGGG